MGLKEYLLIGVGLIAAAILIIIVARRISAFYRERYNMSIWAGVFTLIISAVIAAFAILHYETPNIILLIIAGAIIILTGFLDIYHAGVGLGLLAVVFQLVFAALFVAVIIAIIAYLIIRALRRGEDAVLDAVTGTSSSFRNSVQLFFRFFALR